MPGAGAVIGGVVLATGGSLAGAAVLGGVVAGGIAGAKALAGRKSQTSSIPALPAQPTRDTAASVAEARKEIREEESKKRGRRASILTGSRSVTSESPFGLTQTPQARGLTSVLG